MISFENVVGYIAQPPVGTALDERVEAGANFDPLEMCEYCRTKPAGDAPRSIGNVSYFARCRYQNGCVVCGFCGVGLFDGIGDGQGIPDCPECGGVEQIMGSRFMDYSGERRGEAAFFEWHRKLRCLDVFAAAVGMAVFMLREEGCPMDVDEVEGLLYSALCATRLAETDDCVNRFFDRVQDTMREAGQQSEPVYAPLRLVTSSEPSAS